MNKEELKNRLAAYYRGESSREEEKWLMDYFTTATDMPEEFAQDAVLFKGLAQFEAKTEDIELPSHISDKLDKWMEEKIAEEEAAPSTPQLKPKRKQLKLFIAVAASLLFIFTAIGVYDNYHNYGKRGQYSKATPADAVHTDSDLTYAEAKKVTEEVLTLVAQKLSKGVQGVSQVEHNLEKVNTVINNKKRPS